MPIDFGPTVTSWIQKIHNVRVAESGTPLLHYTSIASCLAILESESIWFNEFRRMNDPEELKHGVGVLRRWFESIVESATYGPDVRKFVDCLMSEIDNFIDEYSGLFVCCLSGSGDRLYHWRSYGDDGRGVAIEFDKAKLLALPSRDRDVNFLLTPVVYDEKGSASLVERLADTLSAKLLDKQWLGGLAALGQDEMRDRAKRTLTSLAILPLLLKSPDYRIEAEWRLVACPSRNARRAVATHPFAGREVRHLAVRLDELMGQADPVVPRILLGPGVERADFEALYRPIRDKSGRQKPTYEKTRIRYTPRHG